MMPIVGDQDEHDRGEREGNDDLAGCGVAVGDHSQQVGKQNKSEERKDEGEELPPALPDIAVDHIGDELVEHFGNRLPSARNQRRATGSEHHQRGDGDDGDGHHQRRVRVRDVEPADMDRDNALDCELLERMKFYCHISSRRRPTRPGSVACRGRPRRAADTPQALLMPETAR